MITVLRASGLSFEIYTDDHSPPHVHVFGDGRAKIQLVGRNGRPVLLRAARMKDSDVRKAMRIVEEHQAELLKRWSEIHG